MRSPIATGADEWEFFFQQVWRRAPPALPTPPSVPHLAPKVDLAPKLVTRAQRS
jgi:hypothetical protein